jgi:hypothetical protein
MMETSGVGCIHLAGPDLLLPSAAAATAVLTLGNHLSIYAQANELEYATKYYAAILARSTGKDLATCQKEYLSR